MDITLKPKSIWGLNYSLIGILSFLLLTGMGRRHNEDLSQYPEYKDYIGKNIQSAIDLVVFSAEGSKNIRVTEPGQVKRPCPIMGAHAKHGAQPHPARGGPAMDEKHVRPAARDAVMGANAVWLSVVHGLSIHTPQATLQWLQPTAALTADCVNLKRLMYNARPFHPTLEESTPDVHAPAPRA